MNMTLDVPQIVVPLCRRTIEVTKNSIAWHRKPRLNVRERDAIEGPRVYRWVPRGKTHKIDAVHIGKTERFEVRLRSYCIAKAKVTTRSIWSHAPK